MGWLREQRHGRRGCGVSTLRLASPATSSKDNDAVEEGAGRRSLVDRREFFRLHEAACLALVYLKEQSLPSSQPLGGVATMRAAGPARVCSLTTWGRGRRPMPPLPFRRCRQMTVFQPQCRSSCGPREQLTPYSVSCWPSSTHSER